MSVACCVLALNGRFDFFVVLPHSSMVYERNRIHFCSKNGSIPLHEQSGSVVSYKRTNQHTKMSDLPPPKPWSVDVFQQYRNHLTRFVDTKLVAYIRADGYRRILIRAPVKSGKREIAEYAALRDHIVGEPRRVHAFVSAWHRVADDEQRKELKDHNLHVFSIINRKKANECISWMHAQLREGRHVVVHLDECDHGSGTRQILGQIWREIRGNDCVTTLLYSATPEEVLYSGEVGEDADVEDMMEEMMNNGCYVRYTPPTGFCGPAEFLDAELVEEAVPFFRKTSVGFELSEQGRTLCSELRESIATNPTRNIVVLRLSYSSLGQGPANRKENKSIYQFLKHIDRFPELADFAVVVDKDEKFDLSSPRVVKEHIQWSNPHWWRTSKSIGIPTLVVIDQTSSRSTEWSCHNRVYAVHDFRNILQFATISQAQERVNHYAGKYGGFQPIKVYGNTKTFMLSAGRIDYDKYLTNEWFARKIDRRRAGDAELYLVKKTDTDELHSECPEAGVSKEEADRILQECASYADAGLSARVRGGFKNVAIVQTHWFPCDLETFDQVVSSAEFVEHAPDYNPRNPFIDARMEGDYVMGNLRGYRVFQYDEVERNSWGFNRGTNGPRLTICYRQGVLGLALRVLQGFERRKTLAAFKSMYIPRD